MKNYKNQGRKIVNKDIRLNVSFLAHRKRKKLQGDE
jgi:hypothetical protein